MSTQYIYDMSDTWDDGGTTFVGIKMDVTDTASASNSMLFVLQVGSTDMFSVDKNGEVYAAGAVSFAERTHTPSGTTQTVDLTTGNHVKLDVGSASGALTVTFTPPASSTAGTLIVKQDGSPKDISWAVTGGTITWLGTEPTWSSDTSKDRVVSWRWDGDASVMYLIASETN